MIDVNLEHKKNRGWILWLVIGVSVLVHVALYAAMPQNVDEQRSSYLVKFSLKTPPKPQPPKPKPKPSPPPKPKVKPKPKHKPKPKTVKKAIKKKKQVPLANTEANKPKEPPAKEPPKPVFGLTKESVIKDKNANSQVAFRVGNTLMKQQEKEITDPNDVKPYSGGSVDTPVPAHLLTKQPSIKHLVKPEYTEEARLEEIEGVVLLAVTINSKGKVIKVRVLKGLGYGLDEAAIEAIKKTKFSPAMKDGRPVTTTVKLPVRFVLED